MSDLISRSEAMENYCNVLCPKLQKGECCNDCIVKAWLNNQSTAYDVDKVVTELEKKRDKLSEEGCCLSAKQINDAIKIVKAGGNA